MIGTLRSSEADKLFEALKGRPSSEVVMRLATAEIGSEPSLRNAFAERSDENHAWYLLGSALEEMGRQSCAAKCFKNAFLVCRDDADAYVAYSNTEDENQKIIDELEVGINFAPDPRVMFNLSNSYIQAGRLSDAKYLLKMIGRGWENYEKVRENLEIIRARKKRS
jgi:tetratricopeptide (TPR) repeat protein